MKKITAVFLIFLILLQGVSAQEGIIKATAEYLMQSVPAPSVSASGGEWTVLALARGNVGSTEYYEKYYSALCGYLKERNGILHSRKYTEYARVVLTLSAIGKNPADVEGYNLLTPLFDFDACTKQGINGAVWALIALGSGRYGNREICDRYIDYILDREKQAGGWALSAAEADADITAMALTALSRYRDREDVAAAVERGIEVLSKMQLPSGGYENSGAENSESAAQVIVAISALGISTSDTRFIKNGKSVMDALLSYRDASGAFMHTDSTNLMATEQCLYALVAADRQEKGQAPLFDIQGDKNREMIKELNEILKIIKERQKTK